MTHRASRKFNKWKNLPSIYKMGCCLQMISIVKYSGRMLMHSKITPEIEVVGVQDSKSLQNIRMEKIKGNSSDGARIAPTASILCTFAERKQFNVMKAKTSIFLYWARQFSEIFFDIKKIFNESEFLKFEKEYVVFDLNRMNY